MISVTDVETVWKGEDEPARIEIVEGRFVRVTYMSGRQVKYLYNRNISEVGSTSFDTKHGTIFGGRR